MKPIRNGSFETGDASFWEIIENGTFTVQDSIKKYGSYAAQVVAATGTAFQGITTKDYVKVDDGTLINLHCWVKTTATNGCRFKVCGYDSDLNLVISEYAGWLGDVGDWTEMDGQYNVPAGVTYVQIAVGAVFLNPGETMYVDSVVASSVSATNALKLTRTLIEATNKTTSGNSIADAVNLIGGDDYYAELGVTSFTGTAPTMDIDICEYDEVGYIITLGSFTQVTGTTNERISINRPIGNRLHAKWTMGGAVTDADFKINVIGVR